MYHIQSHEKGNQQALNCQHAYSDSLLRNLRRQTADEFTNPFLGNTESSILVTSETRRRCCSPHTQRPEMKAESQQACCMPLAPAPSPIHILGDAYLLNNVYILYCLPTLGAPFPSVPARALFHNTHLRSSSR